MKGVQIMKPLPLFCHYPKKKNPETIKNQGFSLVKWWAHLDLNQGPPDYESGALTD